MPLVSTLFDLSELEAIGSIDTEFVESCDFGACACGQLKLVLYTLPNRDTDHCTYSHGEILFKLANLDGQVTRQEAIARFLEGVGCKLVGYR